MVGIATTRGGVIALPVCSTSSHEVGAKISLMPLDTSHMEGYDSCASLYVYDGTIVELMRYQAKYGSWMYITNSGQEVNIEPNGSFTMVTPVDPLFVALGFMVGNTRQSGMFEPQENLLDTNNNPQVNAALGRADVSLICDTKSAGDEQFFRFSPDKARRWLDAKVFHISNTSSIPKHESAAVVAQYLPTSWGQVLTEKYPPPQKKEDKATIDISQEDISDAQKMALEAMQSDVKKENDAIAAAEAEADSEPPKKKKKVSSKKVVARSSNPITSFFKKK